MMLILFQTKGYLARKNVSSADFSARTDALASKIGISLRDLANVIGISQAMLFAYRTGRNEPTLKAWRKLEAAEEHAGITSPGNPNEKPHHPATGVPSSKSTEPRTGEAPVINIKDLQNLTQALNQSMRQSAEAAEALSKFYSALGTGLPKFLKENKRILDEAFAKAGLPTSADDEADNEEEEEEPGMRM